MIRTASAWTQSNYQFENITEADGLSDNRVTCFFRDRTGYLWIGTENGLNRYDGHSFLIYNAGQKKNRLSNSFINDIEEDASGKLWVTTQYGLNIIDPKQDTTLFVISSTDDRVSRRKNLPSNLIWDIFIDKKGRVWMAADSRDLWYFDTTNKTYHSFPWRQYAKQSRPDRTRSYNSIRKIYPKSDHELWLGTSAGLFSFHIDSATFRLYPSMEADHFISLQQSPNQDIYFMQEPSTQVQVFYAGSRYGTIPATDFSPDGRYTVNAAVDPTGLVWMPAGRGLLEINSGTGQTRFLTHTTDNAHSLPAGVVRAVFRDSQDLVWVATDHGAGKFNPLMTFFSFTPVTPPAPPQESEHDLFRVSHTIYSAFYSAQDDKYYLSSPRHDCLYILDRKTGQKETIREALGIPLLNCSVIYEDRKGMLWILAGTHAFNYDRRTKKFSLTSFESQKKNLLFTAMTEDNDNNYWFACMNDGLYRFNPATGNTWKPGPADSFSSILPTSLFFDHDNNELWIGTFDYGLYQFRRNGNGYYFNQALLEAGVVTSSLIMSITKDNTGKTWVATYDDGISVFSGSGQTIHLVKKISRQEGLPENRVFSLIRDNSGNIWAATFKGISEFSPDIKLLRNYDQTMGLSYSNFHSPFSLTKQGRLLTGVENGFIEFHPDSLQYRPYPFSVALTSFLVLKKDILAPVDTSSTLVFPYNENEVQFNFAALNFNFTSRTQYNYILEGQDKARNTTS
ncbi:MAG: two-component regulator propeller domain-containing protein [Luteolibacter sp.]